MSDFIYKTIAVLFWGAICFWGTSACVRENQSVSVSPPDFEITDKSFCISVCRAKEFENFHGRGESWGTGSSSMNGLGQTQIYDTVTKTCEAFYADKKCCKANRLSWEHIHTNHSHSYGACK